jgi:hypothetical protein
MYWLRAILVVPILLASPLTFAEESCAGKDAPLRECSDPQVNQMKIRIVIGDTTLNATLENNATARDFAALLPLTLQLNDYSQTEKVSDLPRRLSTAEAPAGGDPAIGDIAYYAPWGNLAIFYRDFSYSRGLIRLGHIESEAETLRTAGPLTATIELSTD